MAGAGTFLAVFVRVFGVVGGWVAGVKKDNMAQKGLCCLGVQALGARSLLGIWLGLQLQTLEQNVRASRAVLLGAPDNSRWQWAAT
jgi:hypothetical protein